MTEVTWVLVGDGGHARLFQTLGLTLDLQEIEDLANTEYSGTVLTEKGRKKFARRVAEALEQGRLRQRYHRLRLSVEPKFLGMVQADLSEETRRVIFEHISEDLYHLNTQELQAHFAQLG